MAKDPCCFGCDGCLNLLIETVVLVGVFFAAVALTVLPLLGV
ncbi:MAG: hypothetical protein AB7E80_09250 [Hyphomicrobiaceae bacterium]